MGIQELARASGCSVASIKFYLREGLLMPGDPTRAHRAYYDARHRRRLGSIRAMRDAGVSIEAMRRALSAVDEPGTDAVDVIAPAIDALAIERDAPGEDVHLRAARRDVEQLFARAALAVRKEAGSRETLARALASMRRLGAPVAVTDVALYLDALRGIAELEINHERTRQLLLSDKETSLEIAVLGTVLYEPVLIALRRALHEHFATRLVGKKPRRSERPAAKKSRPRPPTRTR